MIHIILISAVFILLVFLCIRYKKVKLNQSDEHILCDIALILLFFLLVSYLLATYNFFNKKIVISYMFAIKEMLQIIVFVIIFLFFTFVLTSFLGKRYSLRVDNFNLGGINVIFDKSNQIFIKTVGTYISSKRSLFKFNEQRDNIFEVLNTYYDVYNVIRKNLELLDSEEDNKLYEISFGILKHINVFLTKHQNDYRRWYDKVVSDNRIVLKDAPDIIVHKTTIETIQKRYYRYDEILSDIKNLNQYMSKPEIAKILNINTHYWSN